MEIYGPLGLRTYLRVTLGCSYSELGFNFVVHELEPVKAQLPPEASFRNCSPDLMTDDRWMFGLAGDVWVKTFKLVMFG